MKTQKSSGEQQARTLRQCVGCDRSKGLGLIVCWDCFERKCPKNPKPFKYSYVSFEDWQRHFTVDSDDAIKGN